MDDTKVVNGKTSTDGSVQTTAAPETTTTEPATEAPTTESTAAPVVTTAAEDNTTAAPATSTETVTTTTVAENPTNEPTAPQAAPMAGDVNDDGKIDIMDVIALNKHLLGSGTLSDRSKLNADVDKNGVTDTTDSLNILKFVVELIPSFDSLG
ncbi:MAG: dockerin type I repeat-containing protein [Oscillospiraceae bacterium]|nr:dockerin type I repeat-containing protein [Oscillospiraceae bacterium]